MQATMKTNRRKRGSAGFTLTEILIAMFILALGMMGVMSLFPVGLDATTRAINNNAVFLASQTAFAQVNYMVNTSEAFDYRLRRPYFVVSPVRPQTPTWVAFELGDYRAMAQYPIRWNDRTGYYLNVISGTCAGQTRRIISAQEYDIMINRDTPFLNPEGNPCPLDATSCFTITRWALPRTAGSCRMARVAASSAAAISAKEIGTEYATKWDLNEFTPGSNPVVDDRFFVVFVSGMAKGKVCPVTGQSGASAIFVTAGVFSPADPVNGWLSSAGDSSSRVRVNDAFMILGNKEVDSVFPFNPLNPSRPSNFGTQSAGPDVGPNDNTVDQTVPFGATRLDYYNLSGGMSDLRYVYPNCQYSYAVIMSNFDDPNDSNAHSLGRGGWQQFWYQQPIPIPRDAFDPTTMGHERSAAMGARVDVLVFSNYDYYKRLEDQAPSTLVGTSTTAISSFF